MKKSVSEDIEEIVENPIESSNEFIEVLRKVMLTKMRGQELLNKTQVAQMSTAALRLLKANKIKPDEVGLVIRFVMQEFVVLAKVDSANIERILKRCLRHIYSNMHNVPVVDIALSLECLPLLHDASSIEKFTMRI